MAGNWHVGNAVDDSKDWRGWFVGHFLDASTNVRASETVEIKWGVHPKDEGRDSWHTGEQRTTVVLLIKGRFRLDLSTGSFLLKEEGDYAMWGPGVDHSWQAEEDSVVITVRWPSRVE
jgi:quercetin dioxygenase-like cupin family protein